MKETLHNRVEALINRVKSRITQLEQYKQEYIKEERWVETSNTWNKIKILELTLEELEDLLK
jgi:hypothetical protein